MTNQRNIPALHQKVNILLCIKSSYKSIGEKKININRRKAKDRNVNKCWNKCPGPLVIKEVQSETTDTITHPPHRLQFKNYKTQAWGKTHVHMVTGGWRSLVFLGQCAIETISICCRGDCCWQELILKKYSKVSTDICSTLPYYSIFWSKFYSIK